jgi:hypothetical protein
MGPTGALYPDLLWPIQKLSIQCVWPSTPELGRLLGVFMVLQQLWSCVDFASPGAWKGAPPKPRCQYSEAVFKPLQYERVV